MPARTSDQVSSNPETATQLLLSRNTVTYHLYTVFTNLGAAGRIELIRFPLDECRSRLVIERPPR
jgi:DNA-binding CsgD family transcriptional regulator